MVQVYHIDPTGVLSYVDHKNKSFANTLKGNKDSVRVSDVLWSVKRQKYLVFLKPEARFLNCPVTGELAIFETYENAVQAEVEYLNGLSTDSELFGKYFFLQSEIPFCDAD